MEVKRIKEKLLYCWLQRRRWRWGNFFLRSSLCFGQNIYSFCISQQLLAKMERKTPRWKSKVWNLLDVKIEYWKVIRFTSMDFLFFSIAKSERQTLPVIFDSKAKKCSGLKIAEHVFLHVVRAPIETRQQQWKIDSGNCWCAPLSKTILLIHLRPHGRLLHQPP